MDKPLRFRLIGEVTHCRHPGLKLFGGRGAVKDLAELVAHHAVLVVAPKSSSGPWVVKGSIGHSSMKFEDHFVG